MSLIIFYTRKQAKIHSSPRLPILGTFLINEIAIARDGPERLDP
ncbi:hypothetical protein [Microbulbifer litoralis]|nr:hypothetical protein [Microbulbifer sp. GX H0434]